MVGRSGQILLNRRNTQALQALKGPHHLICGAIERDGKAEELSGIKWCNSPYSQGTLVGTRAYQLRHRSAWHAP